MVPRGAACGPRGQGVVRVDGDERHEQVRGRHADLERAVGGHAVEGERPGRLAVGDAEVEPPLILGHVVVLLPGVAGHDRRGDPLPVGVGDVRHVPAAHDPRHRDFEVARVGAGRQPGRGDLERHGVVERHHGILVLRRGAFRDGDLAAPRDLPGVPGPERPELFELRLRPPAAVPHAADVDREPAEPVRLVGQPLPRRLERLAEEEHLGVGPAVRLDHGRRFNGVLDRDVGPAGLVLDGGRRNGRRGGRVECVVVVGQRAGRRREEGHG